MLEDVYKRDRVPLTHAFGISYPEYFIHPAAEYQVLTRYAGLIDLTHWSILRVTGKDRVTFLNAMLTNDVSVLETNRGCHALVTTVKGKIVAELYVFAREGDVLLLIAQGDAKEAYEVLQKHIIMEDVTVEDLSLDFGVLALEGPRLEDTLWRLFAKGPFPKENLHAVDRKFEDADIYLMKNSVTGETGYHLMIPATDIKRIWRYLVQACRGTDGLPIGSAVWNMRRVENGLPWYGVDFSLDNFPDESGLGDAISYNKGCFRGQETLARLHHRGHVNRVLVGLTVEDGEVAREVQELSTEFEREIDNYDEVGLRGRAEPVVKGLDLSPSFPAGAGLFPGGQNAGTASKPVGWITSAVYSPALKKPLLLAYVRVEVIEKRQTLRMESGTKLTMIDLPVGA